MHGILLITRQVTLNKLTSGKKMKVRELEKGMILQPAGDNEVFLIPNIAPSRKGMPYLTVRCRPVRGKKVYGKIVTSDAMYVGTRKDLNVGRDEINWSDRYVLIDGSVAAVDPSAWARIKTRCN